MTAHNEGLKTELQRLRQLYQQQQLQQPVSPFWLAVSSLLDPRIVHNVTSCIVHTHKASSLQGVSPKFDEKFIISQEVSGF